MNLFTIENLSLDEIAVLRQALNVIEIKGSSAQFIANLQIKLDNEINQIKLFLLEEEKKKQAGIKKIEKATKAEQSIFILYIIDPKGKWAGNPVTNRNKS